MVPLSGQTVESAPQRVPEEPDWPIDPSTYPRPSHPATRAIGPIRVDGRLDEPSWEAAPPITQFVQSQPDRGFPATEKTDLRILYDDRAIYLACFCYDSQPDRLTITSLARDFNVRDNDVLSWVLNPDPSRRNGFLFSANAAGASYDSQVFDDMRVSNTVWESQMEVRGQVTDFGWTVEIAIPWTSLRFEGSEGVQEWGFNALRRIRRLNEVVHWAPLERYEITGKVSRAGTITGLEGLRQGRNLRVKPYFVGSMAAGSEALAAEDKIDGGGDLKYGVTSSTTLDLTFRTDFSQVEVDQVQVNLTRFPLFFPEQREFFVENAGFFAFGDETSREYRLAVSSSDFTLFHSRRIGLTRAGEPVPILGGARLTGELGDFEFGTIGMRTRSTSEREAENAGAARVRWRFLPGSSAGVVLTHQSTTQPDGAPTFNRAYGTDASVRLASHLLLTSYLAGVEGSGLAGSFADRSAFRVSAGWRDGFWNASALFRRFGERFDPGLGFVRRKGIRHAYATVGVHPIVRAGGLQEVNPYGELEYYTTLEGVVETRLASSGLGFTFADGSMSSLSYENLFERLFEDFPVNGTDVTITPGDYVTHQVALSHQTSTAKILSGNVRFSRGGYFSGTRTSYTAGMGLTPDEHLSLDLSYERNQIELPGDELTTSVARLRVDLNPSTRLFTSGFLQYNGLSEELVSSLRLRFIHAPLSDLFLVFQERRSLNDAFSPAQSLALKVTRLFAF